MTEKRFTKVENIYDNYHHRGEENDFYLMHMDNKCRIDRQGVYPKVWRWK